MGAAAFTGPPTFTSAGEIGGGERAFTNASAVTATSLVGSTTGPWTMEALVNMDTIAGQDFARISDSGELRLRFESDAIRLDLNGGTFISPALGASTGTWYHAAWVYLGDSLANNVELYWTEMTGAPTQATLVHTATSAGTALTLGNWEIGSANGGQFDGRVDEFRISNIARSSTDMMFGPTAPDVIPEPSTAVLAILALAGFATFGWRRRRRA